MTEIEATMAPGVLSNYGKLFITRSMYEKGKGFIGAAVLVNRQNGHPSVVLHLLCQGIEIIFKAILLEKDYSHYKPLLRKFGHDLPKTAAAVRNATGLHIFPRRVQAELQTISDFYRQHLLRYASNFDIFIDVRTIPSKKVLLHTIALISYLERKQVFIEH
jgi:hypothetical protein